MPTPTYDECLRNILVNYRTTQVAPFKALESKIQLNYGSIPN